MIRPALASMMVLCLACQSCTPQPGEEDGESSEATETQADAEAPNEQAKQAEQAEQAGNAGQAETTQATATQADEQADESDADQAPAEVQVEVLEPNEEGEPLAFGDIVTVHYTGRLQSGEVFDSSRAELSPRLEEDRPFSLRLGAQQVIPGWERGLRRAKVGQTVRLTIPPSLGYGERGAGDVIPPNATLTFDIEVLKAEQGVKVEIQQPGQGESAEAGDQVTVHYTGRLQSGKVFDSSRAELSPRLEQDRPFTVPLGASRVIPGWDEGLRGMKVGERRRLTIHPVMGYGQRGAGEDIPPNATLTFDVEMLKIEPGIIVEQVIPGEGPAAEQFSRVRFHCKLTPAERGQPVLDTTDGEPVGPLPLLFANRPVPSGVFIGLIGMKAGEKRTLRVPPPWATLQRDPRQRPRALTEEHLKVELELVEIVIE
jgi:FKBP-type peptidyl-prolyl cis-trans isomerase